MEIRQKNQNGLRNGKQYYGNTQTHIQTLRKHTEQIHTQGLLEVFSLVLKICRAMVFL